MQSSIGLPWENFFSMSVNWNLGIVWHFELTATGWWKSCDFLWPKKNLRTMEKSERGEWGRRIIAMVCCGKKMRTEWRLWFLRGRSAHQVHPPVQWAPVSVLKFILYRLLIWSSGDRNCYTAPDQLGGQPWWWSSRVWSWMPLEHNKLKEFGALSFLMGVVWHQQVATYRSSKVRSMAPNFTHHQHVPFLCTWLPLWFCEGNHWISPFLSLSCIIILVMWHPVSG